MSARQQWIWAAALGLHLFLVLTTSIQDFSSTLARTTNLLSTFFQASLRRMEGVTGAILGTNLAESNPIRQALATYANGTGIEAGYSYFAPAVPGNCKLVFELYYPDGRVESDVPGVGGAAAGYRVSTLLDHLHVVRYIRLREALLATLARSIHSEHPSATKIRAVFGVADLTSVAEYRAGKRTSYQVLYAYDFHFHPSP